MPFNLHSKNSSDLFFESLGPPLPIPIIYQIFTGQVRNIYINLDPQTKYVIFNEVKSPEVNPAYMVNY